MTSSTPLIQNGITKTGATLDRGICMILYSDPGVGKTTTTARLPVGETLHINVEAGLGPLLGTNHLKFELSRDLKEISDLHRFLAVEKHPFKYVVIDNISELQEWMLISITAMRSKVFPEVREHGDAANKLREQLHNYRNLRDRGINVIFNAWEFPLPMEKKGSETYTKIYPKVYPKLAPEICGIVDLVGHLEKYEKTEDRYIRFVGNENIIAKSQYRGVEKFEPADIAYIFDKIKKFNYAKAEPIVVASHEEIKMQMVRGE